MEYKRQLFGAASVIALAIGIHGSAIAGVGSIGGPISEALQPPSEAHDAHDRMAELFRITGGVFDATSMERSIRDLFGTVTRVEAESLAGFMTEVRSLGLPEDVEAAAARTLAFLITESPELAAELDLQLALIAAIVIEPARIQLAQGLDDRCLWDIRPIDQEPPDGCDDGILDNPPYSA